MPKTKQIQASCKSISSESETRDSMMVTMGEPDIDHVLEDIYKEDLAAFVYRINSPQTIFLQKNNWMHGLKKTGTQKNKTCQSNQ